MRRVASKGASVVRSLGRDPQPVGGACFGSVAGNRSSGALGFRIGMGSLDGIYLVERAWNEVWEYSGAITEIEYIILYTVEV